MAAILWQVKYSLKLRKASLHRYPVGQNFVEIALSGMVFEIQAFLYFFIFAKNMKIQNGHHSATHQKYPGDKNFPSKSLYLARFSRIQGL